MAEQRRKPTTDEEAVRKVVNGFAETWNRHDMNAWGALFTPDADFVNVAGMHWRGRESNQLITAFLHGAIPADTAGVTLPKSAHGIFKTSNVTHKQVDVRFLRKDVAVAHVQNEMQGDARTKDTAQLFGASHVLNSLSSDSPRPVTSNVPFKLRHYRSF